MQWLNKLFGNLFGRSSTSHRSKTGRLWVLGPVGHPDFLKALLEACGEEVRINYGEQIALPKGVRVVYAVNSPGLGLSSCSWRTRCYFFTNTYDRAEYFLKDSAAGKVLVELARLSLLPLIGEVKHDALVELTELKLLPWKPCVSLSRISNESVPCLTYGAKAHDSEKDRDRTNPLAWVLWYGVGRDHADVVHGVEVPLPLLCAALSESPAAMADAYLGQCPGVKSEWLLFWRCQQASASSNCGAGIYRNTVLDFVATLSATAAWQAGEIRCESHTQPDNVDPECCECNLKEPLHLVDLTGKRIIGTFLQDAALYAGLAYHYDCDGEWPHSVLGGAYTPAEQKQWRDKQKDLGRLIRRCPSGKLIAE